MQWLVVLLALLLGGKALWSLNQALKRSQWEHWLTALGSACLAFALVANAASSLAVVGLGMILVGRSLRKAAVTGDRAALHEALEPKVPSRVANPPEEPSEPAEPYVKR